MVQYEEGKKFGYYVNGSKSWLIVKKKEKLEEAKAIFGSTVNITTEGKRHLGAVIGSPDYKDEYCEGMVAEWEAELENLAEIAKSEPQAAYVALTKAYKSKFTYFMRTIDSFEKYVTPIDTLLSEKFLPALFNEDNPFDAPLSDLLTLPVKFGGLGIPNLKIDSGFQHEASKAVTKTHVESIVSQSSSMLQHGRPPNVIKNEHRAKKEEMVKKRLEEIDKTLPATTARIIEQTRDKGASTWLNAIPFENHGFSLTKREFRDSLRLRYNLRLKNLPSKCVCGHPFNVDHAFGM